MNQDQLLKRIKADIAELNRLNDGDSGTILIHSDAIQGQVTAIAMGDSSVMATGFGNQMKNREGFSQLMLALFGSYLSQEPEEKKKFLEGLKLAETTHGIN